MAYESDLFHRKLIGHIRGGYYGGFHLGGKVVRCGEGTVGVTKFTWLADGAEHTGKAFIRTYLMKNSDQNVYGAYTLASWTCVHNDLTKIEGALDVLPTHIREAMAADPKIFVCTDWLFQDGFEMQSDVVPMVERLLFDDNNLPLPAVAHVPRCAGRVTFVYSGRKTKTPRRGLGFEEWAAGTPFAEWLPAKLAAQRRPIHLIPACAVDDDGPVLSVPLSGGDEWRPGQILLSASNQKRTIGYHFRRPGSEVDEYISASGDLKSPMITGGRMFDERALMEVATNVATLAELRKPRSARLWLGEKYLLPSVQGMHVLTIDRRWIVDEVLTVNPALALAAKWARGVGEYFCYSAAVGANGELLPTKPMSQTEIDETEIELFAPGRAHKKVGQYILQGKIFDAVANSMATEVSIELERFPYFIAKSLMKDLENHGATTTILDGDAAIQETKLTPMALDALVGFTRAPVLTAVKKIKVPDFIELQVSMGEQGEPPPRRRNNQGILRQQVGTVRWNANTGKWVLRLHIMRVKGVTLNRGEPTAPYPDAPPADGGRWVYSMLRQAYVSSRSRKPTRAELHAACDTPIEAWDIRPL